MRPAPIAGAQLVPGCAGRVPQPAGPHTRTDAPTEVNA
jgi:hypothetical protein